MSEFEKSWRKKSRRPLCRCAWPSFAPILKNRLSVRIAAASSPAETRRPNTTPCSAALTSLPAWASSCMEFLNAVQCIMPLLYALSGGCAWCRKSLPSIRSRRCATLLSLENVQFRLPYLSVRHPELNLLHMWCEVGAEIKFFFCKGISCLPCPM